MGSGDVRYVNGCCGTGTIASITCMDGFQLVGDTIYLTENSSRLFCGYDSCDDVFVWAPSGDAYCGRGNKFYF